MVWCVSHVIKLLADDTDWIGRKACTQVKISSYVPSSFWPFQAIFLSLALWLRECFRDFMVLQEHRQSPKDLSSYTGSQLCAGRVFSPSVLMVRAGIFLLCRWCGGCGRNGYDGWKSALPAFYRHPGIALSGHAGRGDVGTVVAVINLVLKSSTKSSFYIDAWI